MRAQRVSFPHFHCQARCFSRCHDAVVLGNDCDLDDWQHASGKIGRLLLILHDNTDRFGGVGLNADLELGRCEDLASQECLGLEFIDPSGSEKKRSI